MVRNLIIRVDSGVHIGAGHIFRCLALVEVLNEKFSSIIFISRNFVGNFSEFVERRGYNMHFLKENTENFSFPFNNNEEQISFQKDDASLTISNMKDIEGPKWLIVDNYFLDKNWELMIKPYVEKLIVIDDLANRFHDCDILVDQNFYKNCESRYDKLLSKNCTRLLGTKYASLLEVFKHFRTTNKKFENEIKRILISFGASDPTNETAKVLESIKILGQKNLLVEVIIGYANPNKDEIKKNYSHLPSISLHYEIKNVGEIMAKCDLAIGAGGVTLWERCCLGIPAIVSILSEDQREAVEAAAENGCIINLGYAHTLNSTDYVNAIKKINPTILENMSKKCINLVDGEGCMRVAKTIFSLIGKENERN